jgi:hypothetical protein
MMNLPQTLVPSAIHMLEALASWLDKGAAFAAERDGRDKLLSLRLAPDMYPLAAQVRFAAFQPQEAVHRLLGQPLPEKLEAVRREGWSSGDQPGTFAAAKTRIDEALVFLRGVDGEGLHGSAERPLDLTLPDGTIFDMTGATYVRDWVLPQFYFHLVTAYAILRHHGIALGKIDYVPHMFAYARQQPAPVE